MDTHEELVWESEVCAAVLGRGTEFVLIRLDNQPYDEAFATELVKRGYTYCGCVGVGRDGKAAARCQPDYESTLTMMHAALAFAQMVTGQLKPAPKSDAVDFLRKLHELEDPRG